MARYAHAAAALLLLLSVPGLRAEGVVIDGVAAHVNEDVIRISDVMLLLRPVEDKLRRAYEGDELSARLEKAYHDALDSLIERRLILAAYAVGEGRIPQWVVDQRIEEIIHDMFADDRSKLMAALVEDGLTYEQWRTEMEEDVIVASMRQSNVDQHVSVSPAAARRVYEERLAEEYAVPERVKLRMIQLDKGESKEVAAAARELAGDIRAKLDAGEDFAVLARQYSTGTHAEDGGDWGWEEPGILQPQLASVALALETGQVSDPVETAGEIYLLTVEGRMSASVRPFAEVQPEIEKELRRKERERLHAAWTARLRGKAYVNVFDVDPFWAE